MEGTVAVAAAFGRNKAVVQMLLDSRAEVNMSLQNADYSRALTAVPLESNTEAVQLFIKSGGASGARAIPFYNRLEKFKGTQ